MTDDKNIVARARDAYAIYMASCEGLSWDNKPCPIWDKLPEKTRRNWYTVALRQVQLQMHDPECTMLGEESRILPSPMVFDHLGDEARVENAVSIWTTHSNDTSPQMTRGELRTMRDSQEDTSFVAPKLSSER